MSYENCIPKFILCGMTKFCVQNEILYIFELRQGIIVFLLYEWKMCLDTVLKRDFQ